MTNVPFKSSQDGKDVDGGHDVGAATKAKACASPSASTFDRRGLFKP